MIAQGLGGFFVSVCRQIVEDHHGSGCDLRDQHLSHIGGKGGSIHRSLDDPRRDQRVWCEACDQRLRSPTAEGRIHCQAMAPLRPATQAGQVRLHGGFVNEDNAIRQGGNSGEAMFEPVGALLLYLGPPALGGDQRLFLYVNPRRDNRLAIEE